MSTRVVRFSYDIVCPYAWVASTQVEALAARHGATVDWDPILLGGVFRALQSPDVPAATWAPQKAVLGLQDVHRQAALAGLDLRFAEGHPRRSVDAMRLCALATGATRVAVTAALYQAYWQQGRDISDMAVLAEIATAHGLELADAQSDAVRQELRARTDAAVGRGVFGVPTLQIFEDGEAVGDLHWGSDRLHLVEGELAGHPVSPEPAPVPGAPPMRVTVFHDMASPYAYLGMTQASRVAEAHGAELVSRPILLGALFRDIGTPIVPLFAMNRSKQQWYAAELARWAAFWGVDYAFPSCFPVRSVTALRASIVAPACTMPLYRALWVDGLDIGQDDVVKDVLVGCGLDAEAVLAQTRTADVKAVLKDNTSAAQALGVCGVPSFVVERLDGTGEPVVLWGQDRIFQLAHVLRGWVPPKGSI